MALSDRRSHVFTSRVFGPIGPPEDADRAHLESLIRADYERCHPGEAFEDLKRRARFVKEDKGLLRDWMALAARRAAAGYGVEELADLRVAAH